MERPVENDGKNWANDGKNAGKICWFFKIPFQKMCYILSKSEA